MLLVAFARKWQQRWWAIAAAGAGVLTVVVSFLYPVVIEPLYNNFHPLQAGPLRDSLLQLAAQDHLKIKDIEVADASKQTTTENAYVSGFGSSRHVVLYDTLLADSTPEQVRLVVAHEFGHVKHHDVARGTVLGALGAVAGVSLLAGALGSGWLRSRAGFSGASDPRCVAAVLALASIVTTITTPAVNIVSRQIEAHADLHALKLTHDPLTFIQVERNLALSNISSLGGNHISYALFATHPSSPDRIAMARTWAKRHGQPVPAPLVPQQ
jgi:STE24 endopeptidase